MACRPGKGGLSLHQYLGCTPLNRLLGVGHHWRRHWYRQRHLGFRPWRRGGEGLVEAAQGIGGGPHLAMAAIVIAAILISQLATNYGGAVILFPIAMSTALAMDANPVPFMLAVMAGAGELPHPHHLPDNLMVYGPGRYSLVTTPDSALACR